jgi:AraC family transcriptional regulator
MGTIAFFEILDKENNGTAKDHKEVPTGVAHGLASTVKVLANIQLGAASPPSSHPLPDGTRVTGRWHVRPFQSYLPGLEDHVLTTTLAAEGRATWQTAGRTLHAAVSTGAFTLVPRGHDGHWRVTGEGIYRGIILRPGRLLRYADEIAGGRQPELLDRLQVTDLTMLKIMHLIGDEVESDGPACPLLLEQLVDLVCLQLLRTHSCLAPHLERPSRVWLAPWQITRVISYMRDNLDQDISLQDLADVVRLSRFHFCTAFRLATDSTPHEALTRLRVDEARRLLASSNQSISEIALAVGFQTPSAFAARFRKTVGLTPRAYRQSFSIRPHFSSGSGTPLIHPLPNGLLQATRHEA